MDDKFDNSLYYSTNMIINDKGDKALIQYWKDG